MKKSLVCLLAALNIFTFAACSKGANTQPAANTQKEEPKKTITIGVLPDTDSVPFVIADKQGYFKNAGVDVKIEQFKSAKDRDSAFQSGKLDGVITDVLAVAFAKEGGFDVKITSKTDGNYKLLAGKQSGIDSLEKLKGKSVAISQNTLIEYATDKLAQSANFTDKDIKKEIVPQIPTRLEMLQNGKVDTATLPEPMASLAVKNGAVVIDSTDKHGINPGVMAFTSKAIKESSKEIKAVYKAYNDAVDYLNKEPVASFADLLVKEVGFPEDMKNSIVLPKYTKAQMSKEKDVTEVLDWMKSKNLIKNSYTFKDLISEEFVK
ncbi:MetQ/NlpA family ABC transporter substrate-binding protein [Clostridium swellfunianum]|uniref:ABC transporter substrate-binding protein n=1 Tax=Clostridium swellfunianum TaxID=1367462 RepID=UPI0020302F68|nr:MetQ/NlpA family ABC transporter substrate-binding protein [Clostridium swellfunianum]MCM0649364.1 MetQ/NlpA family ABC transporter substrate-binding protein [Clostridium swellfunianum]